MNSFQACICCFAFRGLNMISNLVRTPYSPPGTVRADHVSSELFQSKGFEVISRLAVGVIPADWKNRFLILTDRRPSLLLMMRCGNLGHRKLGTKYQNKRPGCKCTVIVPMAVVNGNAYAFFDLRMTRHQSTQRGIQAICVWLVHLSERCREQ